jgi:hypothetical protein
MTLVKQLSICVDGTMELMGICLMTTYCQISDEFYQQTDGIAMGSKLSPLISNIYIVNVEKVALEQSELRPKICTHT